MTEDTKNTEKAEKDVPEPEERPNLVIARFERHHDAAELICDAAGQWYEQLVVSHTTLSGSSIYLRPTTNPFKTKAMS